MINFLERMNIHYYLFTPLWETDPTSLLFRSATSRSSYVVWIRIDIRMNRAFKRYKDGFRCYCLLLCLGNDVNFYSWLITNWTNFIVASGVYFLRLFEEIDILFNSVLEKYNLKKFIFPISHFSQNAFSFLLTFKAHNLQDIPPIVSTHCPPSSPSHFNSS